MKSIILNDIAYWTCVLVTQIKHVGIFLLGGVFYLKMLCYPLAFKSLAKIFNFHRNLLPVLLIIFMKSHATNYTTCWTYALLMWNKWVGIYLLADIFYYKMLFHPLALRSLAIMLHFLDFLPEFKHKWCCILNMCVENMNNTP